MRYPASEKLEIIRLVEQSHLCREGTNQSETRHERKKQGQSKAGEAHAGGSGDPRKRNWFRDKIMPKQRS